MISGDLDARLDEALSQLAEGDTTQQPTGGVPEIAELVLVARRLHTLAPAPIPNLEEGRSKFLAEAARVGAQTGRARRWPEPSPSRMVAFAASAVIVLVAGIMITLIAGSFAVGIPGAPGWGFSSTPTSRPTYTATPRVLLAPVDSVRLVWVSEIDSRPSLPPPNPAPQAVASRQILR